MQSTASKNDGNVCFERCWARSSMEPGGEPFLRDRGVARFPVEMVVGLRERVSGLQEQMFAFRACWWSWLGWSCAWMPLCWFHLVGVRMQEATCSRCVLNCIRASSHSKISADMRAKVSAMLLPRT